MSKVRLFGHSIVWLSTVSVAVLAIVLLIVRLFMQQLPGYKSDLEQYLGDEVGLHVSITDMAARLDGFKPQIKLTGVSLNKFKQQQSSLNIAELRLSFDLFELLQGRLIPSNIIIDDTNLSIHRFVDGHVSIEGLSIGAEKKKSSSTDFSWLLQEGRFELRRSNIIWQDDMRDVPDVQLTNAHVLFQNSAQGHQLGITASLPKGGWLTFSVNATGDILSGNNWQADGYFKAKQLDVPSYLARLKIDQFSVKNGLADVELWSHWRGASLQQVKGYLTATNAQLELSAHDLNIDQAASQFIWTNAAKGWGLQVKDFTFQAGDISQPHSNLAISYQQAAAQASKLKLIVNGLNVEAMSHLARYSSFLNDTAADLLTKTLPRGELNNGTFTLNSIAGEKAWSACADMTNFSSKGVGKIPSLNAISARACTTQDDGWLDIDTSNGSVHFHQLFRDPIVLDTLVGQVDWQRAAQGWQLSAEQLVMNSPHVKTNTRLKVVLPAAGGKPLLDMQMNFMQADARFVSLYLPVGTMGAKVVKWLDNAFINGRIKGGGFLLKGPLASFPYRKKQGLFQVLFDVESVDLHYADKWPDVLAASATVEFKNEGLNISANTGRISSNQIKSAQVSISDLKSAKHLKIVGNIDDDISGLYRFFKQSPLNNTMSGLLEHTEASGRASIDLDINVALKKQVDTHIKAQAHLFDNSLTFPALDLAVDGVQGLVNYDDQHGLRASGIKARVLDDKVVVGIKTGKESSVISAQGLLNIERLSQKYPAKIWAKLTGKSLAELEVSLPYGQRNKSSAVQLRLSSQLKGVAINLPQPVGKKKGSMRALKLSMNLAEDSLPLTAKYGDNISGQFLFATKAKRGLSMTKADIHLGRSPAQLPAKSRIRLSGVLDTLNLDQWQKALFNSVGKTAGGVLFNQLDLKVGKLHWLDKDFDQVHVRGEHQASAWVGMLSSPVIKGRYRLPDNLSATQRITLDLDSLSLPENKDLNLKTQVSPLSPGEIPSLDLSSDKFFIGTINLGRLNLQLRQKDNGLSIKKLTLTSARDTFQAKGAWELKKGDNRTALSGHLTSQALGGLLKNAGITDKLRGAPTEVLFDLNWPGEPQAFSKNHLSGFAKLTSGQGRLLDVEPGIGRIFGLLSLSTLQRRLQLDFSDLLDKGLSFDKIKGRLVIVDGEAQTKRFYLESPSARLDFQGRVGLAKEDLNQLITVTPNTTESLPLAGVIAGGPLLGAAIFVVQKIAGKTVNEFVGYQYQVSGPWTDPSIKQISKPGGKIFGMVGNLLSTEFNLEPAP